MFNFPNNSLSDSRAYSSVKGADKFGDPFLLPSLAMTPTEPRTVFDFCKFLYGQFPEWAQAGNIISSYFITDVDFTGEDAGDATEQEEVREWLHDGVEAFEHQRALGADTWCMGNGFGRFYSPFDRYLVIPTENGYLEMSVHRFPDAEYDFSTMKYKIDNPVTSHRDAKNRQKISVSFFDRASRDINRIKLARIDPSFAWLQFSYASGRSQVVERFDPMFLASIKRGDLFQVNDTPQAQLLAISKDMDFIYNEDEIFHLKHPTISGISNGGWGVPHILLNFASLYQLAVYRRVDQAVGLDYVLPLRILSPAIAGSSSSADAYAGMGNMQIWQGAMAAMIRERQANPFKMFTAPFPVMYQEAGANKQLAPKDSLMFHQDSMLSSCGLPPEMFRGSLSFQASPVALRIFENQWRFYGNGFSRHLRWLVNQRQDMLGLERFKVRAKPPRTVDDLDSRHVLLQLAAGGEMPRGPALQSIGIRNAVDAMVERRREDIEAGERIAKLEAEAAARANGAISGPGGAPAGAATTPADETQRAAEEAKRLLEIPFDGDRAKALQQIRASDAPFHALVKQKMEEFRASARSAGGQQVAQMTAAA